MRLGLRTLHRYRKTIYAATGISAFITSILMSFLYLAIGLRYPFPLQTMVILVVIGFISFPGVVDFTYGRWRSKVDDAIPRMITDVTSSVKTGLSLIKAFEVAAERDYGPLSEELKAMRAQLSWGVTFEDAMKSVMKRVDTLIARRTFQLFIEANRAGGRIEDLLDAIRNHIVELHNIEKERRATLRPYVVITYIAFGVFLAIAWVLVSQFFANVLSIQTKVGAAGATIFSGLGGLNLASIKSVFFQMALIEAVFGGLGAGKLGEASFSAGFKHIIILVLVAVLVFAVWIG